MKILYAASEAAPFVKTGGLGDVAYALPQALSQREDTEICVFLPCYKAIKDNPAYPLEYITHFPCLLPGEIPMWVFSARSLTV